MQVPRWREEDVIRSCVSQYSQCFTAAYQVSRWPDKEPTGRNAPEIDAYAEAVGREPLAIEHTRIESFEGQLEDNAKIQEVCTNLEANLRAKVRQGLILVLPLFAFRKGFDWKEAAVRIERYIAEIASTVTAGTSRHKIAGVPFVFDLVVEDDLRVDFSVVRPSPPRLKIERDLLASMEQALCHKQNRLEEYRRQGVRSILIVESADLALVNYAIVYKAFLRAEERIGTSHLADVWLVFTWDPDRLYWHCFSGPDDLLASVNPPNLCLGPRYRSYWQSVLAKESSG